MSRRLIPNITNKNRPTLFHKTIKFNPLIFKKYILNYQRSNLEYFYKGIKSNKMIKSIIFKKNCRVFIICATGLMILSILHSNSLAEIYTDQVGRQINIPARPVRVISLAPSITEIICAIGCFPLLKGVTQYSDYPPEVNNLPKTGSYIHLDIERIIALKPDLCIAIKDGNPKSLVERLDKLKIPVYVIDPKNIKDVIKTLYELGNILDAVNKATEIISDMQTRLNRIKKIIASADKMPGVFIQIGISPIVSAGSNTFLNELINLAGGRNMAKGNTPYPRFNHEKILVMKPDIIIITSMARNYIFNKAKSEWARWPSIPAVKNDRIFLIDSNLVDRPTPRLIQGLETLARLIHPELF